MKSEHRRELRTNELQRLTERFLPWLEKHGMKLLIGAVVILVAWGGYWWWSSSRVSAKEESTSQIAPASSAEQYAEAAQNLKAGPLQDAAWLQAGQSYLNRAHQGYFDDRKTAKADLEKAREMFKNVLAGKPLPKLRESALFGLATTEEYLSTGDNSAAIEAYKTLISEFDGSPYAPIAEQKIRQLERPTSEQFYSWISQQELPLGQFKQPFDQAVQPPPSIPQIPELLRMEGIVEELSSVPTPPEILPPAVTPGTPQPFPEDPGTTPDPGTPTTSTPETPTVPTIPDPQPEQPSTPPTEPPTIPDPQPEPENPTIPNPETPSTPNPEPEQPTQPEPEPPASPEPPNPEVPEPSTPEPETPTTEPEETTPEPMETPEPVSPPEKF